MTGPDALCAEPGCVRAAEPTGLCSGHEPADTDVTDEMIARASIPNAAALLRRAAKKGLVQLTTGYSGVAQ